MTNIKIKSVSPDRFLEYGEESMILNVQALTEFLKYVLKFADTQVAKDFDDCVAGNCTEWDFYYRHSKSNHPVVAMACAMIRPEHGHAFRIEDVRRAYSAVTEQIPAAAPDTVRAFKDVLSNALQMAMEKPYDEAADALRISVM